jgi:hypothetical protein
LSAFCAIIALGFLLIRCLWRRRGSRQTFFIFGGFALAVAFFYAEEDLRGWLAWQQFKHQAEAAGEKLDWAMGYSDKEIASKLSLSVQTINSYLKNVYQKMHVHSRTEAVAKYMSVKS